jgi:hypothetical protein
MTISGARYCGVPTIVRNAVPSSTVCKRYKRAVDMFKRNALPIFASPKSAILTVGDGSLVRRMFCGTVVSPFARHARRRTHLWLQISMCHSQCVLCVDQYYAMQICESGIPYTNEDDDQRIVQTRQNDTYTHSRTNHPRQIDRLFFRWNGRSATARWNSETHT